MPTTFADLVVEYLKQLNIDIIFGVPGGAIEPLFDALARSARRGGPRIVVARHECGAAFMADGYYRETGKMGVVCSTTGPGATNLITGVSSAMEDNIPMMVITAQTALPKFGKRALQESSCTAIDTVGMFRYCTAFSTLVSHKEQMESKLVSAIMAAHRIPNGPVHLSIPPDILSAPAEIPGKIHADLFVHDFVLSDEPAIQRLCEKLARVETIAVFIGKGAGHASKNIIKFCELTNAPFVSGQMGKCWINENHPLYRGVYGFGGHASAEALFQCDDIDLVLAVGADLGELGTGGWSQRLLNSKLVHIDSTAEHFTRSPMANLHVCGNITAIFDRLVAKVKNARDWGRKWKNVTQKISQNAQGGYFTLENTYKCSLESRPVKPQRLMTHLAKNLPDTTRVFIDAGNAWAWATHYFVTPQDKGYYRIAMGFGSMAWSIGAAIGSCVANPAHPTICIVGDGAYLMSAQEITVAAQENLPILFFVLNDAALGMVMHGQKMGNAEDIGWPLNEIDYAALAESMGIRGITIEHSKELDTLDYTALFRATGPTLIDVKIDRDEVPPMGQRVQDLKNSTQN